MSDRNADHLVIRLFGPLSFAVSDGRRLRLPGGRQQALLALLASAPDMRRHRSWLIDKLWSDSAPDRGRANLRQLLHATRQSLGAEFADPFDVASDSVGLRPQRVRLAGGPRDGELLEGFDLYQEGFEDFPARRRAVARDCPALRPSLQAGPAMPASAMGLLTARDGIVGPWRGPAMPPARAAAAEGNLRAWPDWCRQMVLGNEVLSRLTYSFDDATGAARVHLLDLSNPARIAATILAEIIAPAPEDLTVQTRIVHDYADLRADRTAEILDQTQGMLGYFARLLPMDAARMPLTLNLLGLAQDCALHVAQQCKHLLACRRPDAFSAQIQPMIATPGHGSLPSGHATEAFAIAELLRRLVPDAVRAEGLDGQLIQMAARIAVNRTVAGVHFPAGSFAGALLGFAVADVIARRAGEPGGVTPVRFDGRGIGLTDFFTARVWQDGARQDLTTDDGAAITRFHPEPVETDISALLRWVWGAAGDDIGDREAERELDATGSEPQSAPHPALEPVSAWLFRQHSPFLAAGGFDDISAALYSMAVDGGGFDPAAADAFRARVLKSPRGRARAGHLFSDAFLAPLLRSIAGSVVDPRVFVLPLHGDAIPRGDAPERRGIGPPADAAEWPDPAPRSVIGIIDHGINIFHQRFRSGSIGSRIANTWVQGAR